MRRSAPNQYEHPQAGLLTAMPPGEYPGAVPSLASWVAVAERSGRALGYITDTRANGCKAPSFAPSGPKDPPPFEVSDLRGTRAATTHTVRGALQLLGNLAAGSRP